MPFYESNEDTRGFQADSWAQGVQGRVADQWAASAVADAPDRAAAAEQQAQQAAQQQAAAQAQAAAEAQRQADEQARQQAAAAAEAARQQAAAQQAAADQWAGQASQQAASVASTQTDAASQAPPQMPQQATIDSSSPEAFIRSITPWAQQISQQTGIPAAAMIGMAANETGYGKFAAGNNLFGIKGSGPAGSINSQTWEDYGSGPVTIRSNFRAYANPGESFQDFADLVTNAPRYAAAKGQTTVEGFVQALKDGGYMTDPAYVGKISSIVQRFGSTINDALQGAGQAVGGAAQAVGGAAQQAANYVFPVQGYSGDVALHWGDVPGGSDLFAPRGTPVLAMRGGKVVEAGYNSIGGNSVLIQGDDGNQYYYAHFNEAPSVKVGQTVGAGTYLGPVGNTGDAAHTGTHLHIGIGPSILLGADKFGGTGGNFDAVGLLRRVLSGQGAQQATGPAAGPGAMAVPAGPGTAGQPAQPPPRPTSVMDLIQQTQATQGRMPTDEELGNFILAQPPEQTAASVGQPQPIQQPTSPFDVVGNLASGLGGAVSGAVSGVGNALGGLFGRGGPGGQPPGGPTEMAPTATTSPFPGLPSLPTGLVPEGGGYGAGGPLLPGEAASAFAPVGQAVTGLASSPLLPTNLTNAGLQAVGQNVVAPGLEALAQPGGPLIGPRTAAAQAFEGLAGQVPSGVPVVGGLLERAAGIVGGPTILDQIGMAQQLANKYPSGVPGLPDPNKMTPEDKAQWSNIAMAVGGVTQPPGPEAGGSAAERVAAEAVPAVPSGTNINLSKYPTEVQDVIQAAAPTIPESARRGVVPDAVVRDLAQQVSSSVPDIVARWQPGQAHNAETLYALSDALANQGRQVLDAQQALRANPASTDAQAALIQALTEHRAVQEVVEGSTAESGRALRVYRQPVAGDIAALQQMQNLAARTGQSADELAQQLAKMDLNDPGEVASIARALNPPRLPPGGDEGPAGPQRGQLGMFGQELPYGGPPPPAGGFEAPNVPQQGQLQFGSELPYGGAPPPTGGYEAPNIPQPGQLQFESELPLGTPRSALPPSEPLGPAERQPGQLGLGIGEQFQQDLPAPSAGNFEPPQSVADLLPSPKRVQMAIEQRQGLGANPNATAPTASTRIGQQNVLPGFPVPKTGSFWQQLNAFHSGNVIMGPATLTKVAINSAFSPAWNYGTQTARDLLTLKIDRATGRTVGAVGALTHIGSDFMDGFAQAMAGGTRSSIPLVDAFLQAQHAVGGALHAGMQNVAAEAVRRMELGAAAGEQVAAQNGRGLAGFDQIADLIHDPSSLPADAVARANDLAQRAGLRSPAGATQRTVQAMLNQAANTPVGAVTNFLLPVFAMGARGTARLIEASPVGLVGTGIDVARGAAGFGPYAQGFSQYGQAVTPLADRLTANLAGTAVTAFLASKSLDGTITGTGPDDPRARANLEAQGWRPSSVLFPGIGYVSYERAPEQLKGPLMLAGAYGDAVREHPDDPQGVAVRLAQEVATMFAKGAPGLSTLADVGGILKGDPYAVGYLVGGSAAGYIPGSAILGNVATAMDPLARKIPTTQGFGAAIGANIEQSIPGLREQLQPRVSTLGQPMPNPAAGLTGLLPWRTPGEIAPGTPGLQALRVLNANGVTLGAAPKTVTLGNGSRVDLTDDEQQQYETDRAVLLDQMTSGLANNQQFAAAPGAARKQVLDRLIRQADAVAGRQVVGAIAQGGDFASRLQGPKRLQEPVPAIRPPLALTELNSAAAPAQAPSRAALPLTSDLATLDPVQQEQLRRQLAGTP